MQEIGDIDIAVGDKDGKATNDGQEESKTNENFNKRGRKLDEKVMVKICDMGNGCWTHHHFTPEI